jgi:ABC-type multidrug transport system permease subunit
MCALFKLIKKNLLLLIRAKASALVVILGPLLVIFLAGLAFDNTNTYNVRIGVYSSSYNELSESFISSLAQNQFKVVRTLSEQACIDGLKEGATHTCLVLSPDFTLGNDAANEMTFYVDQSKINLVWMVLETLSSSVAERAKELSLNLTSNLVRVVEQTVKEVEEKKPLLVELTTQNEELARKTTATKSTLNTLDFSFNSTAFGVEVITAKQLALMDGINNLTKQAADIKKSIIAKFDNASKIINASAQLTLAERANITSALNSAKTQALNLAQEINKTSNSTAGTYSQLNSSISTLVSNLELTKNKLAQAATKRTDVNSELDSARQLLDSSLVNILTLQKSFDDISSLAAQIEVRDPSQIVQPVRTVIKPVSAERTYLNYLFPSLIVLVIMFTAVLLAPTLIILEKKSTAYFRNFMTPTKDTTYIAAIFLTCFLLLVIQLVVILGISAIFFKTQLLAGLAPTILVLLAVITIFTLIGMVVGYLFNSEETATLASISLGSLLLFLSDVIIPIESMPASILAFAQFNPFVVGGLALRRAILFGSTIPQMWKEFAILGGYIAGSLLLVLAVYFLTKNFTFSKYFKKAAQK